MKLAVIQMSMSQHRQENIDAALDLVHQACSQGAQVILLPELFDWLYFPQKENEEYFKLAHEVHTHPFLGKFQALAK